MLDARVTDFLELLRRLDATGCLTVPEKDLESLCALLDKAELVIGAQPRPGRVTYAVARPNANLPNVPLPALFIVSDEDYAAFPQWAETLRARAAYFLNVG